MEEKKHCKWYNDEFCTNDQSPCVADYCPVVEYPELCKFREVAEDINVPNKDEKTIEFDDDVVDLFVEFDEMGFAPTTTCPDPDEYARDWRERLVCAIKRVLEEKAEIATLKSELRKECEGYEEFTKKAKAEIERLTEENDKTKDLLTNTVNELEKLKVENRLVNSYRKRAHELLDENKELQKQVDELTDHLSEKQNALWDLQDDFDNLLAEGKQQAVKDTAKKIFDWLNSKVIMTEIPHGSEPSEEDVEAVMRWQIEEHADSSYFKMHPDVVPCPYSEYNVVATTSAGISGDFTDDASLVIEVE